MEDAVVEDEVVSREMQNKPLSVTSGSIMEDAEVVASIDEVRVKNSPTTVNLTQLNPK